MSSKQRIAADSSERERQERQWNNSNSRWKARRREFIFE